MYYATLPDGGVAFASELQALLAGGLVKRELDLAALDAYLAFGYVPPPSTLIRGVRVLLPGHAARWRDGTLEIWEWWRPPVPGVTAAPLDEAPARLRQLLEDSIRVHRLSDVPVGAFLSGGIDSSAVVGLMSRVLNEPVRTFSVGFSDGPSHLNELTSARIAADAFRTNHTEVVLTARDVQAVLSDAFDHIDQPSFDGLNTYIVSKAARQGGITVALSGLGGDELFGGYDTFSQLPRFAPVLPAWRTVPSPARRLLLRGVGALMANERHADRRRKLERLADANSVIDLYAFARLTMMPGDIEALYAGRHISEDPRQRLSAAAANPASTWDLVTQLEMTCFMGWRLLRDTDAMSMAHSLEVRVPLIDHPVVEFVRGLPVGWHHRFGHPKRLLLESLADVIPQGLLNRPKQGFAFPLEHWMRNELESVVRDTLADARVARRGLFRPAAVRALVDAFYAGRLPYPVIWQLVVLEQWLTRNVDRPQPVFSPSEAEPLPPSHHRVIHITE
jgi:asparagine synthase (glutamine-hydrolysing)